MNVPARRRPGRDHVYLRSAPAYHMVTADDARAASLATADVVVLSHPDGGLAVAAVEEDASTGWVWPCPGDSRILSPDEVPGRDLPPQELGG